jgi:hypothetical protein
MPICPEVYKDQKLFVHSGGTREIIPFFQRQPSGMPTTPEMLLCDTDECNSDKADLGKNNLASNPPIRKCYTSYQDFSKNTTSLGKGNYVENNPGDVYCAKVTLTCKRPDCTTKFSDRMSSFPFTVGYSGEVYEGFSKDRLESIRDWCTKNNDIVKDFAFCQGIPLNLRESIVLDT